MTEEKTKQNDASHINPIMSEPTPPTTESIITSSAVLLQGTFAPDIRQPATALLEDTLDISRPNRASSSSPQNTAIQELNIGNLKEQLISKCDFNVDDIESWKSMSLSVKDLKHLELDDLLKNPVLTPSYQVTKLQWLQTQLEALPSDRTKSFSTQSSTFDTVTITNQNFLKVNKNRDRSIISEQPEMSKVRLKDLMGSIKLSSINNIQQCLTQLNISGHSKTESSIFNASSTSGHADMEVTIPEKLSIANSSPASILNHLSTDFSEEMSENGCSSSSALLLTDEVLLWQSDASMMGQAFSDNAAGHGHAQQSENCKCKGNSETRVKTSGGGNRTKRDIINKHAVKRHEETRPVHGVPSAAEKANEKRTLRSEQSLEHNARERKVCDHVVLNLRSAKATDKRDYTRKEIVRSNKREESVVKSVIINISQEKVGVVTDGNYRPMKEFMQVATDLGTTKGESTFEQQKEWGECPPINLSIEPFVTRELDVHASFQVDDADDSETRTNCTQNVSEEYLGTEEKCVTKIETILSLDEQLIISEKDQDEDKTEMETGLNIQSHKEVNSDEWEQIISPNGIVESCLVEDSLSKPVVIKPENNDGNWEQTNYGVDTCGVYRELDISSTGFGEATKCENVCSPVTEGAREITEAVLNRIQNLKDYSERKRDIYAGDTRNFCSVKTSDTTLNLGRKEGDLLPKSFDETGSLGESPQKQIFYRKDPPLIFADNANSEEDLDGKNQSKIDSGEGNESFICNDSLFPNSGDGEDNFYEDLDGKKLLKIDSVEDNESFICGDNLFPNSGDGGDNYYEDLDGKKQPKIDSVEGNETFISGDNLVMNPGEGENNFYEDLDGKNHPKIDSVEGNETFICGDNLVMNPGEGENNFYEGLDGKTLLKIDSVEGNETFICGDNLVMNPGEGENNFYEGLDGKTLLKIDSVEDNETFICGDNMFPNSGDGGDNFYEDTTLEDSPVEAGSAFEEANRSDRIGENGVTDEKPETLETYSKVSDSSEGFEKAHPQISEPSENINDCELRVNMEFEADKTKYETAEFLPETCEESKDFNEITCPRTFHLIASSSPTLTDDNNDSKDPSGGSYIGCKTEEDFFDEERSKISSEKLDAMDFYFSHGNSTGFGRPDRLVTDDPKIYEETGQLIGFQMATAVSMNITECISSPNSRNNISGSNQASPEEQQFISTGISSPNSRNNISGSNQAIPEEQQFTTTGISSPNNRNNISGSRQATPVEQQFITTGIPSPNSRNNIPGSRQATPVEQQFITTGIPSPNSRNNITGSRQATPEDQLFITTGISSPNSFNNISGSRQATPVEQQFITTGIPSPNSRNNITGSRQATPEDQLFITTGISSPNSFNNIPGSNQVTPEEQQFTTTGISSPNSRNNISGSRQATPVEQQFITTGISSPNSRNNISGSNQAIPEEQRSIKTDLYIPNESIVKTEDISEFESIALQQNDGECREKENQNEKDIIRLDSIQGVTNLSDTSPDPEKDSEKMAEAAQSPLIETDADKNSEIINLEAEGSGAAFDSKPQVQSPCKLQNETEENSQPISSEDDESKKKNGTITELTPGIFTGGEDTNAKSLNLISETPTIENKEPTFSVHMNQLQEVESHRRSVTSKVEVIIRQPHKDVLLSVPENEKYSHQFVQNDTREELWQSNGSNCIQTGHFPQHQKTQSLPTVIVRTESSQIFHGEGERKIIAKRVEFSKSTQKESTRFNVTKNIYQVQQRKSSYGQVRVVEKGAKTKSAKKSSARETGETSCENNTIITKSVQQTGSGEDTTKITSLQRKRTDMVQTSKAGTKGIMKKANVLEPIKVNRNKEVTEKNPNPKKSHVKKANSLNAKSERSVTVPSESFECQNSGDTIYQEGFLSGSYFESEGKGGDTCNRSAGENDLQLSSRKHSANPQRTGKKTKQNSVQCISVNEDQNKKMFSVTTVHQNEMKAPDYLQMEPPDSYQRSLSPLWYRSREMIPPSASHPTHLPNSNSPNIYKEKQMKTVHHHPRAPIMNQANFRANFHSLGPSSDYDQVLVSSGPNNCTRMSTAENRLPQFISNRPDFSSPLDNNLADGYPLPSLENPPVASSSDVNLYPISYAHVDNEGDHVYTRMDLNAYGTNRGFQNQSQFLQTLCNQFGDQEFLDEAAQDKNTFYLRESMTDHLNNQQCPLNPYDVSAPLPTPPTPPSSTPLVFPQEFYQHQCSNELDEDIPPIPKTFGKGEDSW